MRLSTGMLCVFFAAAGLAFAQDSPEAAYGDYLEALASGDVAAINEFVSQRWREEMAAVAEDIEELLEMILMFMPDHIAIENRQLGDDGLTATLRLVGRSQLDGQSMFGVASLVQEGGRWKIDGEEWNSERPD